MQFCQECYFSSITHYGIPLLVQNVVSSQLLDVTCMLLEVSRLQVLDDTSTVAHATA